MLGASTLKQNCLIELVYDREDKKVPSDDVKGLSESGIHYHEIQYLATCGKSGTKGIRFEPAGNCQKNVLNLRSFNLTLSPESTSDKQNLYDSACHSRRMLQKGPTDRKKEQLK
jgi:hypothetical protein